MDNNPQPIPYEKEINELLTKLFREPWMNNFDWDVFLKQIETKLGLSIKRISNDLQDGIDKGHTIDSQIKLVEALYLKLLREEQTNINTSHAYRSKTFKQV